MSLTRSEWLPSDRTSLDDAGATIGELLTDLARTDPDRIALVDGAAPDVRRWSYADLHAQAVTVAGLLGRLAAPGDRIAICGPNIAEWVLVELGAALAGLVIVGINPAMTQNEIGFLLRQSGSRVAVVSRENRGNDQLSLFENLRDSVARDLQSVLALDDAFSWKPYGTDTPDPLPTVAPSDPILIQYTSGTTGLPKGAVLTHGGVTINAGLADARFEAARGSTWLGVVPMHHLTGSVANTIGVLAAGGTHVIAGWEPGTALRLLASERVNVFLAVPTMLLAMMERPDFDATDLSGLDLVVSGGTVVLPEVVHRCEQRFGCAFAVVFGQTEAGAYITTTRRADSIADRTERVGMPLPCFEVRVVDPGSGEIVPCGVIGEFWLRGPSVMRAYHDQPEQTAETVSPDGWMRTGDLGFLDDRGYVQVTGKLKDVIIRSGANVYPREVEARLATHPDVADVAVVGVPDERLGEAVAAFVRTTEGRPLDRSGLTGYARETLAAYKVPSVWLAVEQFPTTASGKVQKFQLREDYQAGRFDSAG